MNSISSHFQHTFFIISFYDIFLGTRTDIENYRRCNLGRVKANAIVTRGGDAYNITEINAFINLFTYAQQFYGRKDQDEFK